MQQDLASVSPNKTFNVHFCLHSKFCFPWCLRLWTLDSASWFLLQVLGLCQAQCLSHLNYQPLCGALNHLPPFFQFSNAGQFSNDQQIKSRRDQVFKMFEIPIENCLLSAALSDKSLKASGNVSRHSLILESIRIMIWCLFVRIY